MKFQIARAREYYAQAAQGIHILAPDARFAVQASMDLYGRILDKIEENGYDNLNKRAYTTGFEKLQILPGSWMDSMQKSRPEKSPPLPHPALRFLNSRHSAFRNPAMTLVSSSQGPAVWIEYGVGMAVACAGVAVGVVLATAVALRHGRRSISAEPLLG
jgi:hypothetical protein